MVTAEAQRTLVKSPPELWSQLSDPSTLEDHLAELGEIRIVRANPEQLVEWEASSARGTVEIKPSGWGTTVVLSMTLQEPVPASEPAVAREPNPADEPSPAHDQSELPEPDAGAEPAVADQELHEPVAETLTPPSATSESAPGFMARLRQRFGRNPAPESPPTVPVGEPLSDVPKSVAARARVPHEMESDAAPTDTPSEAALTPSSTAPAAPSADPLLTVTNAPASSPIVPVAESAQATALLTAVLDRLGEARHRPFSRS
jgi:hypothetical protein